MAENKTALLSAEYVFSDTVVVKNRIFKSAMSERMGDKLNNPTDKLARLYQLWAQGGAGISVTGNIMVDRKALTSLRDVVLDEQSDLDCFRFWTKVGSENNTALWAQLCHPGKQIPSELCSQPLAPSVVEMGAGLNKHFNRPRMLEEHEIIKIIEQFAKCAELCKEVGFGGVQIHAAHGYLISQFLSPIHNIRTDRWGGSAENRMRFVVEVYKSIRNRVGTDYPVAIKLNSADFQRGGFTEEESMNVAMKLDSLGVDQIEISGGTYENPVMMGNVRDSTKERESYFLDYAKAIRSHVKTSLVVTGGFRSARGMVECLKSGAADFVGVARPLALEPSFPENILSNIDAKIELPIDTNGEHMGVPWYESKIRGIARSYKHQ